MNESATSASASEDAGAKRKDNVDHRETEAFDRLASRWWDPEGEFRPLHDINGPRASWIDERASVSGKALVDIGCGGGLLTEAMAERGARVTGVDRAGKALKIAQLHKIESELDIDYAETTAEDLAAERPCEFDVVTCLEMLEHVPEPASVVEACLALAKPGAHLFFSTINRSPLAWATAIVGAEYVLGLLPRGTHRYDRLIRPSELAAFVRAAGGDVIEISGMHYNPFSRSVRIDHRPMVNYLLHARKPSE